MAETTPVTLSWTPVNWITVIIMVALTFVLIGAGVRIWQQKKQAASGG
jgi:hypothetical protein